MISWFKKLILISSTIIGLLFFCLFFFFTVYDIYFSTEELRWPKEQFTEQKWKDSDATERYKLVKDLLKSNILDGKSKEEVITILGEPSRYYNDRFSYLIKFPDTNEIVTSYSIYVLEIILDENQNILEIRIRRRD